MMQLRNRLLNLFSFTLVEKIPTFLVTVLLLILVHDLRQSCEAVSFLWAPAMDKNLYAALVPAMAPL
jgi:hypothetical protein